MSSSNNTMYLYRTTIPHIGEIEVSADIEMVSGGVWFAMNIQPVWAAVGFWVSVIDYTYEAAMQAVRNEYGEDTTVTLWTVAGTSDEWDAAKESEENPFAQESISGLDLEGFLEGSEG